jgi:hypothetical protein
VEEEQEQAGGIYGMRKKKVKKKRDRQSPLHKGVRKAARCGGGGTGNGVGGIRDIRCDVIDFDTRCYFY